MTVSVTLENLRVEVAHTKIVLATVAPPFGQTKLVQHSVDGRCEQDEDENEIQLETEQGTSYHHVKTRRLSLSRRAQATTIFWYAPERVLDGATIRWTFHVSAAFPYHLHDYLFSPRGYWQRVGSLPQGALARSYVLRIPCETLKIVYRFAKEIAPLPWGTPLVEERREDELGVAHEWVSFQRERATTKDSRPVKSTKQAASDTADAMLVESVSDSEDPGTICLSVKNPVVGLRYAMALSVKVPDEIKNAAADLVEIGASILVSVRHLQYTDTQLIDDFNRSVACELCQIAHDALHSRSHQKLSPEQCLVAMDDVSVRAYVWSGTPVKNGIEPEGLWGCFGNSGIHNWGTRLEYGCGIAGHSFRFNRPITYSQSGGGSRSGVRADELYLSPGEERRDWLISIPLRASPTGLPIGVVRLASRKQSPRTDLCALFSQVAASPDRHPDELDELLWRLNLAFWSTVSDEKNSFHKAVKTYASKAFRSFLYAARNSSSPPSRDENMSDDTKSKPEPPVQIINIIGKSANAFGHSSAKFVEANTFDPTSFDVRAFEATLHEAQRVYADDVRTMLARQRGELTEAFGQLIMSLRRIEFSQQQAEKQHLQAKEILDDLWVDSVSPKLKQGDTWVSSLAFIGKLMSSPAIAAILKPHLDQLGQ